MTTPTPTPPSNNTQPTPDEFRALVDGLNNQLALLKKPAGAASAAPSLPVLVSWITERKRSRATELQLQRKLLQKIEQTLPAKQPPGTAAGRSNGAPGHRGSDVVNRGKSKKKVRNKARTSHGKGSKPTRPKKAGSPRKGGKAARRPGMSRAGKFGAAAMLGVGGTAALGMFGPTDPATPEESTSDKIGGTLQTISAVGSVAADGLMAAGGAMGGKLGGALLGAGSKLVPGLGLLSVGASDAMVFNRGSKGESFFGTDDKDGWLVGILGSRAAQYVGAAAAGATTGAAVGLAGGPFAPITSTVGAVVGGVTGIVSVAVSDYWDDIAGAVGNVWDGGKGLVEDGYKSVEDHWNELTSGAHRTVDKLATDLDVVTDRARDWLRARFKVKTNEGDKELDKATAEVDAALQGGATIGGSLGSTIGGGNAPDASNPGGPAPSTPSSGDPLGGAVPAEVAPVTSADFASPPTAGGTAVPLPGSPVSGATPSGAAAQMSMPTAGSPLASGPGSATIDPLLSATPGASPVLSRPGGITPMQSLLRLGGAQAIAHVSEQASTGGMSLPAATVMPAPDTTPIRASAIRADAASAMAESIAASMEATRKSGEQSSGVPTGAGGSETGPPHMPHVYDFGYDYPTMPKQKPAGTGYGSTA